MKIVTFCPRVKCERAGRCEVVRSVLEGARSLPKRHWPQKAVAAHAATAVSVAAVRLAASRLGQAAALGQLGSKWKAEPA